MIFHYRPIKVQSEYFLAMRRFLPNFKILQGNADVTISIADFPASPNTATTLSPFTVNSSTTKVDTRARGRYANIKIENTGAENRGDLVRSKLTYNQTGDDNDKSSSKITRT